MVLWSWEVENHSIVLKEKGTRNINLFEKAHTLEVDGEVIDRKEGTWDDPDFHFKLDGKQIDIEWVRSGTSKKPRCRVDGKLIGPKIEETPSESRELIIVLLIIVIIILFYMMGFF